MDVILSLRRAFVCADLLQTALSHTGTRSRTALRSRPTEKRISRAFQYVFGSQYLPAGRFCFVNNDAADKVLRACSRHIVIIRLQTLNVIVVVRDRSSSSITTGRLNSIVFGFFFKHSAAVRPKLERRYTHFRHERSVRLFDERLRLGHRFDT